MSEFVIYGVPQSSYVRTARMALEEKGQAYRLEPTAPRSPEQFKLHPFGKVPAFRHGDVQIYETSAIARYVDETVNGTPLQPGDAAGRARMNQLISAVCDYVYDAAIRRFVLEHIFPSGVGGKPDPGRISKALEDMAHQLGVIDKALDGQDFLAGKSLSLADLFLAPIVFYLSNFPESKGLLAKTRRVAAWHEAMAGRPSYKNTIPPPPPGK